MAIQRHWTFCKRSWVLVKVYSNTESAAQDPGNAARSFGLQCHVGLLLHLEWDFHAAFAQSVSATHIMTAFGTYLFWQGLERFGWSWPSVQSLCPEASNVAGTRAALETPPHLHACNASITTRGACPSSTSTFNFKGRRIPHGTSSNATLRGKVFRMQLRLWHVQSGL